MFNSFIAKIQNKKILKLKQDNIYLKMKNTTQEYNVYIIGYNLIT